MIVIQAKFKVNFIFIVRDEHCFPQKRQRCMPRSISYRKKNHNPFFVRCIKKKELGHDCWKGLFYFYSRRWENCIYILPCLSLLSFLVVVSILTASVVFITNIFAAAVVFVSAISCFSIATTVAVCMSHTAIIFQALFFAVYNHVQYCSSRCYVVCGWYMHYTCAL